jgi:SAM-dependent methyltransferase
VTEGDFVGPIGNASPKYEAGNPVVRHLLHRFLCRVDEAVAELRPTAVLDVGCGEGVVTERLANGLAPAKVLGLDADEDHLKAEWKSRSAPNLSFTTGSAYDLPFEDGSFDLVCCIEVLEHLERPRDALAEMSRVAGRALLLSVPNEPGWRISHLLAGRNVRALGNTSTTGRSVHSPSSSRPTGGSRRSKVCFRGRWLWPASRRRGLLADLDPVDPEGLPRTVSAEIPIGIDGGDAPVELSARLRERLEVRSHLGPLDLVLLDGVGEVGP